MEALVARERLDVAPAPACRLCSEPLLHSFADLGLTPLANGFLRESDLPRPEVFYPLHAHVCSRCFLVQLPAVVSPEEIFLDYAYFSSYSESWLDHARQYAEATIDRFGLGADSQVVEVASNDGYLLQFFAARGVPVLGVDPARNVAEAASARGIETITDFFGAALGRDIAAGQGPADLVVANNVLAHVPDVHDFVEGLHALLSASGAITLEFPHLLRLIEEREFDTIYHEHFSYFSLLSAERLLADHDLAVFDVDELHTHGGSLRVYACHAGNERFPVQEHVDAIRMRELEAGLADLSTYDAFDEAVRATKRDLLEFLVGVKREGRSVVGYGAAAKGNTLLNYCGIGGDFLDYVVDRNPHKQGLYLPGSRLPIREPEAVVETRPDYLLLLAWNLKDEIVSQMRHVRDFDCRFVTPVPSVDVFEAPG